MITLLGAPGVLSAQDAGWRVTDYSVAFEIRNAGLPVRGTFQGLDAHVCFDPARPEAGSRSGTIDPATIGTGIALRDRHLQRRGWFEVDRFGVVEMRSERLWKHARGFTGHFVVRIRDVERQVVLPFTFERQGEQARIMGEMTIDRLDFGLGKPSVVLADDVTVEVEVALVRGGESSGRACR